MAAASEVVLMREVTELPGRPPLLIAPLVKPPVASPALTIRVSNEMRKLALKYDVSKIGERKVGKGLNFYSKERSPIFDTSYFSASLRISSPTQ